MKGERVCQSDGERRKADHDQYDFREAAAGRNKGDSPFSRYGRIMHDFAEYTSVCDTRREHASALFCSGVTFL